MEMSNEKVLAMIGKYVFATFTDGTHLEGILDFNQPLKPRPEEYEYDIRTKEGTHIVFHKDSLSNLVALH